MQIFNKTIGKAGGFATAFLGAVATEHLSHGGGPVFLVLSHLLTHIGSEFIAPIGEEIIEQFKNKRPNELNHDIQRELIESMQDAVEGIEVLYKDKYPDKPLSKQTKNFIKKFKKEFFEEFSPKQGYTIEENELKKIIYASDSKKENQFLYRDDGENTISKALNERLKEEIEKQNIDTNFSNFFIEKFLPLTQFYFGERLKHDKNGAARRAMERMLSEETLAGINKLIKIQESNESEIKNNKFLGRITKLSPHKIGQLKSLVKEWNEPQKLEVQFSNALDERFNEIINQYKYLHADIISIKSHIYDIRRILSTNMRFAFITVIVCVIIATIFFVRNRTTPFGVSVILAKDKRLKDLPEYPLLKYPAKLLLLLPDGKTETALVNSNNESYFPELNSRWLNKKLPIKLEDRYWELSSDSIILSNERISLSIKPNNALRYISGSVFSKKDGKPIEKVEVKLEDTTIYTNIEGVYKLTLPDNMLKDKHEIKFFATGFKDYSDIFLPNSTKGQVPLTPLKY